MSHNTSEKSQPPVAVGNLAQNGLNNLLGSGYLQYFQTLFPLLQSYHSDFIISFVFLPQKSTHA